MPKIASITSMARRSSHARAWIWPPITRAFTKYSSLWITTRNASELTASRGDTLKLNGGGESIRRTTAQEDRTASFTRGLQQLQRQRLVCAATATMGSVQEGR